MPFKPVCQGLGTPRIRDVAGQLPPDLLPFDVPALPGRIEVGFRRDGLGHLPGLYPAFGFPDIGCDRFALHFRCFNFPGSSVKPVFECLNGFHGGDRQFLDVFRVVPGKAQSVEAIVQDCFLCIQRCDGFLVLFFKGAIFRGFRQDGVQRVQGFRRTGGGQFPLCGAKPFNFLGQPGQRLPGAFDAGDDLFVFGSQAPDGHGLVFFYAKRFGIRQGEVIGQVAQDLPAFTKQRGTAGVELHPIGSRLVLAAQLLVKGFDQFGIVDHGIG